MPGEQRQALAALAGFFETQAHTIQSHGGRRGFCVQQAHNASAGVAVAAAADRWLQRHPRAECLLLATQAFRRAAPESGRPPLRRRLTGSTNRTTGVALSADGRHAVSAGLDGRLRAWDVDTGRCFAVLGDGAEELDRLALTGDGALAVTLGRQVDPDRGEWRKRLRIWDLVDNRCVYVLEASGDVEALSLSRDGRRLVFGGYTGRLEGWDLATSTRRLLGETGEAVTALATADGNTVLSAHCIVRPNRRDVGELRMWDFAAGTFVAWPAHAGRIEALALSADGRIIASSSFREFRVWEAATQRCLTTFDCEYHHVASIALTANGDWALTGADDRTVRVWDLSAGKPQALLGGHSSPVTAVNLSDDGMVGVSAGWDRDVIVWDLEPARVSRTIAPIPVNTWAVASSPDGARAVTGGGNILGSPGDRDFSDFALQLWNLRTGAREAALRGSIHPINSLAWSRDGTRILSGSGRALTLWDLATGEPVWRREGHRREIWRLALAPDGRHALSGDDSGGLRLWDLETGQRLRDLQGHEAEVRGVAISPDGLVAVSAGFDRTVRLWDLATGRCLQVLHGHQDKVSSVSITPDGRHVVSDGWDGTLRIWELGSGACLRVLRSHPGPVATQAVMLPDGAHLVSTSSRTLAVTDLRADRVVALAVLPYSLSGAAVHGSRILLGNAAGELLSLEIRNLPQHPGWATHTRRWHFGPAGQAGSWEREPATTCPWCAAQFPTPAAVIAALQAIERAAGLSPGEAPSLRLPADAWEHPGLRAECPACHRALRFNPFPAQAAASTSSTTG